MNGRLESFVLTQIPLADLTRACGELFPKVAAVTRPPHIVLVWGRRRRKRLRFVGCKLLRSVKRVCPRRTEPSLCGRDASTPLWSSPVCAIRYSASPVGIRDRQTNSRSAGYQSAAPPPLAADSCQI